MRFHTFGDSHAKQCFEKFSFADSPTLVHLFPDESMISAIEIRRHSAINFSNASVEEEDIVLFSCGEHDCRCKIHRYGDSWREAIAELVFQYVSLIAQNEEQYSDVIVMIFNVLPPVRSVYLGDPKYPFAGSDEQRKEFVQFMNELLAIQCKRLGFYFLNVYDKYCDENGFFNMTMSDGKTHIADPDPLILALQDFMKHPFRHKTYSQFVKMAKHKKQLQAQVKSLLQMVRPLNCNSLEKIRVGDKFDGGYVVPKHCTECDSVISIGIGRDVSLDLEFAKSGKQVFQFDHTVDAVPAHQTNERFVFHKKGWGPTTQGDLLSLPDIMSVARVSTDSKWLLKFDVDGAEYECLNSLDDSILAHFETIICELHGLDGLGNFAFQEVFSKAMSILTQHHAPVHLHANNYGRIVITHGIPVPTVIELSLIRRDLVEFDGLSFDPIPGPLDNPNRPDAPDFCLNAI
ncbi:MAG: hypothetical protein ABL921_11920 [Pirellula sp.]